MQKLSEYRVLVTGAGGFIGPRVVQALLDHRATVRALVGPPQQSFHVLKSESLRNVVADICDVPVVKRLIDGVDIVVHMAGPASVAASFSDPVGFASAHVIGTSTVLDACANAGVKRFVYISSAEVYGRPQIMPVHEDHPSAPRSPYGAAKAAAEQFVQVFAVNSAVPTVILRLFSVYGPGASPTSLCGTIFRMATREDAVILRDLSPVRDYCFIDDVADAIVRACVMPLEGIATVNIGSGIGMSVAEFASAVVRTLGRSIPVWQCEESHRPPAAEIYNLIADRTRAERLLGWKPTTSLEAGIRACL
jgi:nucleoside-diphosphate-sugar epimerase